MNPLHLVAGWTGRGLVSLVLAAAVPSTAHADDATRRHALLVGANDGGAARTQLRYAHDDARSMQRVLTELGGMASPDIALVLDPDLTALRDAMNALAAELEEAEGRQEVLFYYSGHSDEEGLLVGEQRLPWAELRSFLDELDARVRLAVLDSCASGALIRSKGGQRVAPFRIDEGMSVDGLAFITSSSRDEVSQEADRIGGSYFTHYLTTGLRGAADRSGDGRVTLTEAYSFARDETLRKTEVTRFGPQHANHEFDLSGSGDLVLTDLGTTDATLVLGSELAGLTTVRDPAGHLVAELQKAPGRGMQLAVPSGDYTVTVSLDGRYGASDIALDPQSSLVLEATDLVWLDGEEAVARGGAPEAPVFRPPTPPGDELVRVQLLPGMPPTPEGMVDRTLIGVLAADTEGLAGLGVSGGWLDVRGAQQGHSFTLVGQRAEELRGSQWTLGVNIAQGASRGVQASMAVNVAETSTFVGLQSTMGVNWLRGNADAGQFGSVNIARGGLRGGQVGAVNLAEGFSGVQLGLVNVGQDVSGTQIGLVNVARNVTGLQLGIVNVADDVRGTPLGLVSFEKKGRHDLLLFASSTDWINGEVRLGGDHIYTLLTAGARPGEHLQGGLGFGVHTSIVGPVWTDYDVAAHGYVPAASGEPILSDDPTLLGRGRVTVGVQLLPQLAPFVGASVDVAIVPSTGPSDDVPLFAPDDYVTRGRPEIARIYPGVFAGLQF